MNQLQRFAGLSLLFLVACGPEEAPRDSSFVSEPAVRPARTAGLKLEVTDEEVRATLQFTAVDGCPVVAPAFAASLNGEALKLLYRGSGQRTMERMCTNSPMFPSTCTGDPHPVLSCNLPLVSGEWLRAPALVDQSLDLTLADGTTLPDGGVSRTTSWPLKLAGLRWTATTEPSGVMRLKWEGAQAPVTTKAVVRRETTPVGEYPWAAQQVSATELELEDVAHWGPGTLTLTTSFLDLSRTPYLQVEVRQVLRLP